MLSLWRETSSPFVDHGYQVFYQNGIGTGSAGLYQKYVGSKISGATGEGLIFNIREAYAFICSNYHDGDEIILIGFSRGAFTARSISSLIKQVGLLTTKGLSYLVEIVDDWEYQLDTTRVSPYPDQPWQPRPNFQQQIYHDELQKLKLTRQNIPIKCVAVWDTVGSLGVPTTALQHTVSNFVNKLASKSILKTFKSAPKEFAFVDTSVLDNIEYAFHSLGLDERRASFTPTLWYKKEGQAWPKVLRQTWFPGVHSDVGGSYDNNDLANLTLSWMVGQLETYKILTFNQDYILRLIHETIQSHELDMHEIRTGRTSGLDRAKTFGPLREWGLGKIHDSYTAFFHLGGAENRTPMEYQEVNRNEGATGRLLQGTNEAMHASVRVRMARGGLGYNDKGRYESVALKDWSYSHSEVAQPDTPHQLTQPGEVGKLKGVHWMKLTGKDGKQNMVAHMPEDDMTAFERLVLRHWTAAEDGWESTANARERMVDSARVEDRESPISESYSWRRDRGIDGIDHESLTPVAEHPESEALHRPKALHVATDVQMAPVGHTPREQVSVL